MKTIQGQPMATGEPHSRTVFAEKLRHIFDSAGRPAVVPRGEFLIREGEIEKNLYFIESGALRVFYLTEFEEMTIRLGYKGSFINSLSSFINGTPSEFYIDAIRKTNIRVISKQDLLNIAHESTESLKQYVALLESLITQQIEREVDLLITSPAERLKRVLQRSPNLFREIPLKYIASYLRMKPETLSRIRSS
ncbi:MAG TPA: Crp/Fnr family transcriptional regulator [Chryseosolibacter sp.]